MPIVQIDMLEGRDADQKRRLIRMVTDAICEALDARPETVRVIIREMRAEHYGIAGVSAAERTASPGASQGGS
jgi:4-oxalocrotonate tautomerase